MARGRRRESLEKEFRELNRVYRWDRKEMLSLLPAPHKTLGLKTPSTAGLVTDRSKSRRRRRVMGADTRIVLNSSAGWLPTFEVRLRTTSPSLGGEKEGIRIDGGLLDTPASNASPGLEFRDAYQDGRGAKQHREVAAKPSVPTASSPMFQACNEFDSAAASPPSPTCNEVVVGGCRPVRGPGTSGLSYLQHRAEPTIERSLSDELFSAGDGEAGADGGVMASRRGGAHELPRWDAEPEERSAEAAATAQATSTAYTHAYGGECSGEKRRGVGDAAPASPGDGGFATGDKRRADETAEVNVTSDRHLPTEETPPVAAGGETGFARGAKNEEAEAFDSDGYGSKGFGVLPVGKARATLRGKKQGGRRERARKSGKRRVVLEDDSDSDKENLHPARPVDSPTPSEDEGSEGYSLKLVAAAGVVKRAERPATENEKKSRRPCSRRRVVVDEDSDADGVELFSKAAEAIGNTVVAASEAAVAQAVDDLGEIPVAGQERRRRKEETAGPCASSRRKMEAVVSPLSSDDDYGVTLQLTSAGAAGAAGAPGLETSGDNVLSDDSKRTVSSVEVGGRSRAAGDRDSSSFGDEGSLDVVEEGYISTGGGAIAMGGSNTAGAKGNRSVAKSVVVFESHVDVARESGETWPGSSGPGASSCTNDDDEEGDDDTVVYVRRGNTVAGRGAIKTTRRRKVLVESSDSDRSPPRSRLGEGSGGDHNFASSIVGSEPAGEHCGCDDVGHGTDGAAAAGTAPPRRRPSPRRQTRRVIYDDEDGSDFDQESVEPVGTPGSSVDPRALSLTVDDSCSESDDDRGRGNRPTRSGENRSMKPAAAPGSLLDDTSDGGEAVRSTGGGRGDRVKNSHPCISNAASPSSPACPVSRRSTAGGSSRKDNKPKHNDDDWSIDPPIRRPNAGSRRRVLEASSGSDDDPPFADDPPLASPTRTENTSSTVPVAGETPTRTPSTTLSDKSCIRKPAEVSRGAQGGGGTGERGGVATRRKGRTQAAGGVGGGADSGTEGLHGFAFSRARESLTASYFAEFNNGAFGGALSDVRVTWSARLNSTAGVTKSLRRTNASGGYIYLSVVELSSKVLDSEFKLRQTLLHELCHAAAWVIDHNSKPPHGDHFWAWANRAMAAHPGVPVTTCHSYVINHKYRYMCIGGSSLDHGSGEVEAGRGCGAVIGRHSKSIDVATQVCGRCKGRLALFGTHGTDGRLKKPRAATGFSLFVKEHYAEVRNNLPPGTKQQQVMKEISRQWAVRGNLDGLESSRDKSPSRRACRAGSFGGGAKAEAKTSGGRESGGGIPAAASLDKENPCIFDLT